MLLILLACTASPDDTTDTTPSRVQGEDQSVVVFDGEYVYFGDENRREVDVDVVFPPGTETYSSVIGHFALRCPNDRCDWWDRYGTFGIVIDDQYIELDRFITPYRVGAEWQADLTPLRPLLTDGATLRVFIDTWVGEGHDNGDGWLFDARIEFVGGPPPSPESVQVVPVWGHLNWHAGLPDNPVDAQVAPQTLDLPDADSWVLRSFISGHGWNNSQNCAEFCSKEHFYTVDGVEFSRDVWRDDCAETVTDGTQRGTWKYSRAGWCPGAQVFPWDTPVDVTEGAVSYRLEDFTWAGDGDQPHYYMSAVMIGYAE